MATSKITNFFRQTKNANTVCGSDDENSVQKACETNSVSTQFYHACLNEQNELCENKECIMKKNQLKKQLDDIKEKCRDIEYAIRVCDSVMSDKDTKIKSLEREIKAHAVDSDAVSECSIQEKKSITPKFNSFSAHISSEKLAFLRSIGPDKREDSTFVSASIKALYADKLDIIKTKSLTGRSKSEQPKQPITPEKRSILNELFTERINSITNDCDERKIRMKKINDHIRFGLINISKKIQSECIEAAVCQRLAETAK